MFDGLRGYSSGGAIGDQVSKSGALIVAFA